MTLKARIRELKETLGSLGGMAHSSPGPEVGKVWTTAIAYPGMGQPIRAPEPRKPGRDKEERPWQRRKQLGKLEQNKKPPED
jgi:hypothetical protein